MDNIVLQELENIKFPVNRSRNNISSTPTQSFCLGHVNYRGQKSVGYKTRGPSKHNDRFPALYKLLQDFIKEHNKDFEYTTIQVNKNILCLPHVDKNNVGPSYAIALGDFDGGKLAIQGKQYDIKNRWKMFDGRLGHWTNPFEGTRYSLIYFTHTFKPPSGHWRNITVTKEGMYKKGEKIVDYTIEDS